MHHRSGLQEYIPDNTRIPGQQRQTMERRVRGAGGAGEVSLRQAQPARVFARADRRPPARTPAILLTDRIHPVEYTGRKGKPRSGR